MSFQHIWNTFQNLDAIQDRDIDVRTLTRKVKEGNQWIDVEYDLHYYKWSSCWRQVMKLYPDATYKFTEYERDGKVYDVMYYPNGTGRVECTVTILGFSRTMWLPVMNYRNDAVPDPDARAISDTKMRCLVKTVAMFGLGLDLYEGKYDPDDENDEDAPSEPETTTLGDALGETPPQFTILDVSGNVVKIFGEAKSWLKALQEVPELAKERNRDEAKRVVQYVRSLKHIGERAKNNLITAVDNQFDGGLQ
jgi:hypothetical protein|tara:strand:- start:5120 stop:5869 length:750 start_codon:yes stop_codon:yes gene_type:complete